MKLTNVSYGFNTNQKLDIFIPDAQTAHAIVYIHGGAFMVGNKYEYPSFLAEYSNKNIFASIDYRLINDNNLIKMADILSDVKNALFKIIEISNTNGVTIKDFILIGHSAGGHIGLLYGYKFQEENIKIAACISLAGPTDFTDDIGWSSMIMWGHTLEERLIFLSNLGSHLIGRSIQLTQLNWTKQNNYSDFKNDVLEISPIHYVSNTRKVPPTLLVHARNDIQVPYSNVIKLKTLLDEALIPNKLITPIGNANDHMLGGELHTSNTPVIYKNQPWVNEAKKWIETYLL